MEYQGVESVMKVVDLKPGMLIKDVGLITSADATRDDKFWEAPNIHFMSMEDPYWGSVGRTVKNDEDFQVLFHQADTGYQTTLRKMLVAFETRLSDVRDDIKFVQRFLK